MNGKRCFFIGQRDAPEELMPILRGSVERHITELGVLNFVVGRYGSFDRLAARAVREAKKRHPTVTLTLLRPYHPAVRPTGLPEGFDDSLYPAGMERIPKRLAISWADRYMIAHADYLIAYSCRTMGNTFKMLKYARRLSQRGALEIHNLAEKKENPDAFDEDGSK